MRSARSIGTLGLVVLCAVAFPACEDLVVRDVSSLLAPRLMRSELVGLVAGCGTTFAALPDLLTMLRRRSSAGMNLRMAAILALFQFVWIYYGLLILSRPVIVWNAIAVVINLLSVWAFVHFARKQETRVSVSRLPD